MTDDILARIPCPHSARTAPPAGHPGFPAWTCDDCGQTFLEGTVPVAALEAAQARIAALEIDLELGWSRSGLQERVALALRERDNAQARIAELEAERDQYKFLLTESHSSDHYRAEKAEAEAARYRKALNEELEARAVSYRLNPAGRPPAVEPETIDLMVALKESIDAEREPSE